MNKLFFLSVFFLVLELWAAPDVEIMFKTKTNLNVTSNYRVQVKSNQIFFDAEQIDPVQLPSASRWLQRLANVQKDSSKGCSAGTYTHLVKKEKKEKKVTGCLESPQASELILSVNEFQKLNILKK